MVGSLSALASESCDPGQLTAIDRDRTPHRGLCLESAPAHLLDIAFENLLER